MEETENTEHPRVLRDHRTARLADILRGMFPTLHHILVVGCGDGMEAAVLAKTLQASVTGIDLETQFSRLAMQYATLQYGDALDLKFADESFDFVYSYHALEHIRDPMKALAEIRRVLRVGGGYLIGTPNRHRLIGYIGSDFTFATRLRWNARDWRARIMFRFRNDYGAHAGFSKRELSSSLTRAFGNARDINHTYYAAVYPGHTRALDFLFRTGLDGILLPSVYFTGFKGVSPWRVDDHSQGHKASG